MPFVTAIILIVILGGKCGPQAASHADQSPESDKQSKYKPWLWVIIMASLIKWCGTAGTAAY